MPKGVHRFPVMLETEKKLVGLLFSSQDLAEIVLTELEAEDFYDETCKLAFHSAKDLVDSGGTLSALAVHERSGVKLADLEEWSGLGSGFSESQTRTLLSEVRRVSALRRTYDMCKTVGATIGKDSKLDEVLGVIEASLYKLDRQGSNEPKDGAEVIGSVVDHFVERVNSGGGAEVSTGLKALDRAIIGLKPGKVVVVAGRPGMGKTALSDTIRRSVTAQKVHPIHEAEGWKGYGVIHFNLEMDKDEIVERELAVVSQVDLRKILSGRNLTPDEFERAKSCRESIVPGRWFIDDRTYNIAGIRRRARILAGRMARQGIKVAAVVLDYIQLAGDNGEGREQSVAAISRGCKLMAKELGCTVVALSQLNRSCEGREDKRPLLADLRESGTIEQDADVVLFVYREHQYNESHPAEDAELIIRKQRNGPTGTIRVKFNTKQVCFEDTNGEGNQSRSKYTQGSC